MNKPDAFTTMSELETVLLKQRGLTHLLSRATLTATDLLVADPPAELDVLGIHALAASLSEEVSQKFHRAWEAQNFSDKAPSEGGGVAAR